MTTMTSTPDLDRLHKVYEAKKSQWIEEGHEGEWVAIGPDDQVIGFFEDYGAAYTAAAQKVDGRKTFLLQEILRQDRLEQIQLLNWS